MNEDFLKYDYIIYHGPRCVDGFTAAYCAHNYYKDTGHTPTYIPANYGDDLWSLGDFTDKSVLIVDVTFPLETLLNLNWYASKVTLLDHHKSAIEKLQGSLPFENVLDSSKSGAMLAYEHFFDDTPAGQDGPQYDPPDLIRYVQDRDLWKWELKWSREINAVIQAMPHNFDEWDELLEEIDSVLMVVGMQGRAILTMQDKLLSEIVAHKQLVAIKGQPVYAVNTSVLQSDVCDKLLQLHPGNYAVAYYQAENGDWRFSVRSHDGIYAASDLAAKFPGGGGHRNAAGFTASKLEDVFE